MKRISIILAAALALVISDNLSAQQKADPKGGISADMLKEIRKGYEGTASDKAIKNALNTTAIGVLAANSENIAMIDTHFSDQVKTKGITDQKSSGRCWLFSGLNVLRARMIDKSKDKGFDDREVDWLFSNPIGDGGQFTGVANLVMKYGVVPSDVMPETLNANSTSAMRTQIATKLREDGLKLRDAKPKDCQALKTEMLKEIYRMLVLCLGEPPTEFEYTMRDSKDKVISTKTYTPLSFYQEYVGEDLNNNYIMLMNDPSREYGKVYEIAYDRHVYDGQNWVYLNVPVETIKEIAIKSIKDNTAMYFSCDVGKFSNRQKGTLDLANFDYNSLFGTTFGMDKKQRIMTHASGSSHAMTLIAVDIKDGKPVKWMVENSWGAASGYKGNLIMTDEWFNEYMFRLVVEKKYVPESLKAQLAQKPILLPAWDPMFMPEE